MESASTLSTRIELDFMAASSSRCRQHARTVGGTVIGSGRVGLSDRSYYPGGRRRSPAPPAVPHKRSAIRVRGLGVGFRHLQRRIRLLLAGLLRIAALRLALL